MASLAEILVLRGLVPIEKLERDSTAPRNGDGPLLTTLIEEGLVSREQMASAVAEQADLPLVGLVDYPIEAAAVALIPPAMCRRHRVLPLQLEHSGHGRDVLVLAMADPGDVVALDDVRAVSHLRVRVVVAEPSDLEAAIDRHHRADGELTSLTTALAEESEAADVDGPIESDDAADDAPIVRFVNLLISQAIQDQASDIHIEPGERQLRVRYRIDGVLHEMQSAPRAIQNGVISRLKIMSDIDIAEKRKAQDGRMSVTHGGRTIDLRVATLPTIHGEKVVLRILDNGNTAMGMQELHLLDHNLEVYKTSYSKPYGMILVTGPTGSGKSTTLYTTLHAVARPEINVITVEDPVEYKMDGINQVQVNPKAGLTFASALRAILRSDPDVVLIGEIRDHETAQIAIEASLTGHLVLSTLHTNDAPSAITRLIEMGIEPFLVGSALDCVMAQRLARRLCERCKAPEVHTKEDLVALDVGFVIDDPLPALFGPVGCATCSNTGYRGRIAIQEIMSVSESIERLAVERASSSDIGRMARQQGMRTLREDGWAKARLGLISVEEILRVVA